MLSCSGLGERLMLLKENCFSYPFQRDISKFVFICMLNCFRRVRLRNPMDLAHKAPLSMGILQAGILEWVAMPSSRASSLPRIESESPASLHCRWILYLLSHWGSPCVTSQQLKIRKEIRTTNTDLNIF